jgi:hypothetical protein
MSAESFLPSPLRGGAGGGGLSVDLQTTPSLDPSPQGGGRRRPTLGGNYGDHS